MTPIIKPHVLVLSSALDTDPRAIVLDRPMTVAEVIATYDVRLDLPTIAVGSGLGEPKPIMRGEWHVRMVRPGETLAFVPVPAGGSLRSILAAVAGIALAIFAPWAAGWIAGAALGLTGTALTIGTSVIAAGIMMAGQFLINRLLPAPAGPGEVDKVYTARASSNAATPGDVIPVLYGRLRYPPPYAARPYAEFDGDDQYLYQLHCMSVGDVDVERWEIGDTLVWTKVDGFVEAFAADTEIEIVRPGEDVTLFPANVTTSGEVDGQTVPDAPATLGPFAVNPPGTEIERIAVDYVFPLGLCEMDKKGRARPRSRSVTAEYREIDAAGDPVGTWLELFTVNHTASSRTPLRKTEVRDVAAGRYEVRLGASGNDESDNDSRILNRVAWAGLRGYLQDFETPAGVTLIATKIRATEHLSSQSSGRYMITATRRLPIYTEGAWSEPTATRSPAWAAADLLRNPDYGLGLSDAEYDRDWLVAYAPIFQSRGDNFDGLFDRSWQAGQALDALLRAGRSYHVRLGSLVGFVRDEPKQVRRAAFTPDTVVRGSIRRQDIWFSEESPDYLEVTFLDGETWRERSVMTAIGSVGADKPQQLALFGVTNHDHAWREGIFQTAENAYRRSFRTFQVEREGRMVVRGDPVVLHDPLHDLVGFARLEARNNNDLTIDRAITPEPGEVYHVSLRDKTGREWGPCLVDTIDEATITLNATDRAVVEAQHGSLASVLPDPDTQEPAHVSILKGDDRLFNGLVIEARPVGDYWEITLVNDDPRVYQVDETEPVPSPWVPPPRVPDIPDRPIIEGLYAHAVLGAVSPELEAGWRPAPGADRYFAEISYDEDAALNPAGASWLPAHDSAATRFTMPVQGQALTLRVSALGLNRGPWAYREVIDVPEPELPPEILPTDPPPQPTDFAIISAHFRIVTFSWKNPVSDLFSHVDIWFSETDNIDDASHGGSFRGEVGSVSVPESGKLYYFWIKSVSRFGVESAPVGPVSTTASDAPPAKPTGLILTSVVDPLRPGMSVVTATWDANSEADLAYYDLELSENGGNFVSRQIGTNRDEFRVRSGTELEAQVRAVNGLGLQSPFSDPYLHTAAVDSVPPAVPANPSALGGFGVIWLKWDRNTEADLSHYEVFERATATPAPVAGTAATFTTLANQLPVTGFVGVVTRHYWVRAVDISGNKSAWSARVQATTTDTDFEITTEDLQGLVDATSFAASIAIPGLGTTLPAAPFEDDTPTTFFKLPERVLYQRNATNDGWIESANASLIVGQLVAGQIGAGAIGADQIAAGAIRVSKLLVTGSDNIYPDYDLEDPDFYTSTVPLTFTGTASNALGRRYAQFGSREAGDTEAATGWVAIEPSSNYLAGLTLGTSATGISYEGFIEFGTLGATGTITPTRRVSIYAGSATAVTRRSINVVSASNEGRARFVAVRTGNTLASHLRFGAPILRRRMTGELIVDGSITADKLTTSELITLSAQIKTAIITDGHIVNLNAAKIDTGFLSSDRIEVGSLSADKILIAGDTTLDDWRTGGDETRINGGMLSANTVDANKLTIGSRNVSLRGGFNFEHNSPSPNWVSWSAGSIVWINDNGNSQAVSVAAGSAQYTSGFLYIYWTQGATSLSTTTNATVAFAANNLVLATYAGGTALEAQYGRTIIDGSGIKTGSIDAQQIKANAIQSIHLGAQVVTSDHVATGTLTARHMVIGSKDNLIENPGCETGALAPHSPSDGTWSRSTPRSGQYSFLHTFAGANSSLVFNGPRNDMNAHPACGEGDQFFFEFWSNRGGSGQMNARALIRFMSAAGAIVQTVVGVTVAVTGSGWQKISAAGVAPAGTAYVTFEVQVLSTSTATHLRVDDAYARRSIGGELIVEGSIQASHLNVTSLSAISATLGAVDISEANIGTLQVGDVNIPENLITLANDYSASIASTVVWPSSAGVVEQIAGSAVINSFSGKPIFMGASINGSWSFPAAGGAGSGTAIKVEAIMQVLQGTTLIQEHVYASDTRAVEAASSVSASLLNSALLLVAVPSSGNYTFRTLLRFTRGFFSGWPNASGSGTSHGVAQCARH